MSVSDQLDVLLQEIRAEGVKLLGGSWRKWEKEDHESGYDDMHWEYIEYRSCVHALISIEPKSKTGVRVEVDFGHVPPRSFNPPDSVSQITVDGKVVYARRTRTLKEVLDDEEIPL